MKTTRIVGLASALALSFGLGAQDLTQKVSYSGLAKRASVLISELGKQTNVKMEAVGAAGNEVLIVNVKDVTLQDLMNRIASASSCEWQTANGVLRLVPNFSLQRNEEAAYRAKRLASVRKVLKEMSDSLKPKPKPKVDPKATPKPGQTDEDMMDEAAVAEYGDPTSKALAKMALGLDAVAIANLEPNERLVFSSSPTRMQRALPNNWQPVVAELIVEQNKLAESMKQAQTENPKTDEEEKAMKWAEQMGFMNQFKPIERPPAKVLLCVSRQSLWGGTAVRLSLYDETGKAVYSGQTALAIPDGEAMIDLSDFEMDIPGQPKKPKPQPPTDEKPIEFSQTTKEIEAFLRPAMDETMLNSQPSEKLREILLHPDVYDPLSFAQSEGLQAIAQRKALNVVANLPDDAMGMFRASTKVASTASGYLKQLEDGKTTSVELKDGWCVVKPSEPFLARKNRTDRLALAALIQAADAKGVPALDDIASFALKNADPSNASVAMVYLALFAPSVMNQGMGGLIDWNMIRLWGLLGDAQRQQLKSGGRIPFANFSPDQTALIRKMVYGANAHLDVVRPDDKPKEENAFLDMISRFMPAGSKDYRDEPTEIMPDGLPYAGSLNLKATDDFFAVPVNEKGASNFRMGALGADELAMLKYFTSQPEMAAAANMMPSMERLRLGQRLTLDFTFSLGPGVSLKQTLRDDKMDKASSPLGMDALPEAFRQKIAARTEALKKNPLPFSMGMPGNQAIPPQTP